MKLEQVNRPELIHSGPYLLESGYVSDVQAVRYDRTSVAPEIIAFNEPTPLLSWCQSNGVEHAVNGGFTLYHRDPQPTERLGYHMKSGVVLPSVPFSSPRSGLHIDSDGEIKIIPPIPDLVPVDGDYFQAGPMLVKDGVSLVDDSYDFEGVAQLPLQMDDDWTRSRFPRAALGLTEESIFVVSCNGYSNPEEEGDDGLTLEEIAVIMAQMGVKDALNLDGGSKTTNIFNGRIVNSPKGGVADGYRTFPRGLPLLSAIIFRDQF